MKDVQFKGYAVKDTSKFTEFELIDFQPKTFEDYDVEISIEFCGVCSSDVHTVTGGWGEPFLPLIPGHEIAGKVIRVGDKVTHIKVGQRVGVGAQVCSCFECTYCRTDRENYCPKGVDTYNSKYPNGDIAHGGYSTACRVHERYVFPIPEGLKSEDAASMMCGALTIWNPLKRFHIQHGSKVAIIGLGGLGHYAVQFAKALGAHVVVFSHQPDKKEDSLKMGADKFVLTTEKDWSKPFARHFDLVLTTVDDVAGISIPDFASMCDVEGHVHSVGLPDDKVPPIPFQALAGNGASISVSHIGSKKQALEMLQFAADHGIKTWTEVLSMKDVGKGIQGVKDNKVRYRYLLRQDIL